MNVFPTIKLVVLLFVSMCWPTIRAQEGNLLFYEDFKGNSLDTTKWNYELGDGCPELCGWGNNELQFYDKNSVTLQGGYLHITATKKDRRYYSGKITTKNKVEFTYGTVEVRAKLPKGEGVWPAIWLLGADIDEVGWPKSGEIDLMEYVGKTPHEIHTTLHTPASYGDTYTTKVTKIPSIEEGFHVYKTIWTKESISFYIDDKEVYTYAPEQKTPENWPFDKNFYLIINMAIGGNLGGPNVDDTIFPVDFLIDYVKVYKEGK